MWHLKVQIRLPICMTAMGRLYRQATLSSHQTETETQTQTHNNNQTKIRESSNSHHSTALNVPGLTRAGWAIKISWPISLEIETVGKSMKERNTE